MSATGRTVAQNSAVTLAAGIIGYACSFLASVMVARALGPEGKGVLALVVLTHTLLVTLSNLGLGPANSFLVAKGRHSLREVGWHAARLAFGLGLLVFMLTAAVLLVLPATLLPAQQRVYVLLAGGLVPFSLLFSFFNGALQGGGRIVWLSVLTLTQAIVYVLGVVVLVVILALDVPGALLAYALGVVVSALACSIVMWREARRGHEAEARPDWNPDLVRSAGRFGIRAYLASVVSFLNLRSDQFLVSYLAGNAALGQYSVAVTVAELMLFFPRALSTALLPRITAASKEDAGHLAASATRHTIGASLVGMVVMIPVALLIPLIFGEAYRPAVVPCLLLAPGVAVFSLAPVLSTYFTGQLGKPLIPSLLAALSLIVDLLLVLVLVPVLELPGAALASTIAYFLTIAVMVVLFLRVSHVPARDLYAFRAADLAAYRALLSPFFGRSRTRGESG